MLQKLPANDFKWAERTSQFNEDFVESYNDGSNEGYFFEVRKHRDMKIEARRT